VRDEKDRFRDELEGLKEQRKLTSRLDRTR
jgi:hypothetical protein